MNYLFDSGSGWLICFVTYLLKSTLILGAGFLIVTFWKALAVSEKHWLFKWTLIFSISMPLVSFWLPNWQFLPGVYNDPVTAQISSVITAFQTQAITITSSPIKLMTIIIFIWVAGLFWNFLRVIFGQLATRRIIKDGCELDSKLLVKLISSLNINHSVKLVRSSQTSVPFTCGLSQSVIVVPTEYEQWSESQKRMVLLHELAHITRKDASVYTFLILLNSITWFNPLVWMMLSRIRQLSEEACDEIVISNGVKPSDYADHLLEIVRSIKNVRRWELSGATLTTKSFKRMGGRIMKILANKTDVTRPQPIRIVWLVTMMICAVMVLGTFQIEAGDKPVSSKTEKAKLTAMTDEKLPASTDFIPLELVPEMVKETAPEYPKEARKKTIEGEVWVKALVLKDGTVHKTEIAKSSGHKLLDASAMKAGMLNKYKPGISNKKPVDCWVTYKVSFVLSKDEK